MSVGKTQFEWILNKYFRFNLFTHYKNKITFKLGSPLEWINNFNYKSGKYDPDVERYSSNEYLPHACHLASRSFYSFLQFLDKFKFAATVSSPIYNSEIWVLSLLAWKFLKICSRFGFESCKMGFWFWVLPCLLKSRVIWSFSNLKHYHNNYTCDVSFFCELSWCVIAVLTICAKYVLWGCWWTWMSCFSFHNWKVQCFHEHWM